jgi:hypothetical protein
VSFARRDAEMGRKTQRRHGRERGRLRERRGGAEEAETSRRHIEVG